jgi:hypothetical protein
VHGHDAPGDVVVVVVLVVVVVVEDEVVVGTIVVLVEDEVVVGTIVVLVEDEVVVGAVVVLGGDEVVVGAVVVLGGDEVGIGAVVERERQPKWVVEFTSGVSMVLSQHGPPSVRRSCSVTGVVRGSVGIARLAPLPFTMIRPTFPVRRTIVLRPSGVSSLFRYLKRCLVALQHGLPAQRAPCGASALRTRRSSAYTHNR